MDDAAFIAGLRSRNPAELERTLGQLYAQHSPAVYRFARALSGSAESAADAMQEAFVWFIREGASRFDPSRGSIAALLCGVARNHVWRIRANGARFVLGEEAPEPDVDDQAVDDGLSRLEAAERRTLVLAAVRELPPEFREVLLLVEFEDYSYEEVAQILGCPIGTVRSRLSRARARLKASLEFLKPGRNQNPGPKEDHHDPHKL